MHTPVSSPQALSALGDSEFTSILAQINSGKMEILLERHLKHGLCDSCSASDPPGSHPSLGSPSTGTYLAADSEILSLSIIHADNIHYWWPSWTVCCESFPTGLLLPALTRFKFSVFENERRDINLSVYTGDLYWDVLLTVIWSINKGNDVANL